MDTSMQEEVSRVKHREALICSGSKCEVGSAQNEANHKLSGRGAHLVGSRCIGSTTHRDSSRLRRLGVQASTSITSCGLICST